MLPFWPAWPETCPVPKWRNWQTRVVQVHVLARVWGFESLLRHQILLIERAASGWLSLFLPWL
jgi:hypothetical protein